MSIKTLFSPKKKTTDEIDPTKPIPRNIASKVEKEGYDLEYLQRIQSHGGITFDDKHINNGDGYYQILTIFA